jgi:glycine/serine hydroxymethyltransferase
MGAKEDPIASVQSICRAVEADHVLRRETLPLIPTENQMSPLALRMLGSDLAHRYLLLDSSVWEYPQHEHLKLIEEQCQATLGQLFGAQIVNVRPLSGINAMLVVLAGATQPANRLYIMSPNQGGHGATGIIAQRLGLELHFLPFDTVMLDFDLEAAERAFASSPPDAIYIDLSNLLFPVSLRALIQLCPPSTFVYFDCSQILGLMCDPDYFNPLREGCTIIGGSTHKSFPGPQKGIVLGNDAEVMAPVGRASDVFVSNSHMNSVAALAIAAAEMLVFGKDFSRAVRANAAALARLLAERSVPVAGCAERGYTETHQIWIATPEADSESVARLKDAGIVVNAARIPSMGGRRGIRLGTTEVTRLGMGTAEMEIIANLVAQTYHSGGDRDQIRARVRDLRHSFLEAQYCFDPASAPTCIQSGGAAH